MWDDPPLDIVSIDNLPLNLPHTPLAVFERRLNRQ
mgnify:CR=1 FL=1